MFGWVARRRREDGDGEPGTDSVRAVCTPRPDGGWRVCLHGWDFALVNYAQARDAASEDEARALAAVMLRAYADAAAHARREPFEVRL